MNWPEYINLVETTRFHRYNKRYRYFQYGHKCKYKNQKNVNYASWQDIALCDCLVGCSRYVRKWYRPIERIGEFIEQVLWKFNIDRANRLYWFNRKHILCN